MVSITAKPTRNALKLRLIAAVGAFGVPTLGTPLARIGGVNRNQRNAYHTSLVSEESAKLEERPVAAFGAIVFALNPRPLTDAGQIFNGNGAIRAFGTTDNALGDNVVHVGLKTSLTATELLEVTLGRARSLALQLCAKAVHALTVTFNRLAGVSISIRCDCNIHNAQVNTQNAFNINGRWLFNVTGGEQIELPANVAQITFALLMLKQFQLALTGGVGNFRSSSHCPNADALFLRAPRQDATVIRDCAARPECALRFLVQLIGIAHFGDQANNHLRGQIEPFACLGIDNLMQAKCAERSLFPSACAHPIAGGIGRLKRLQEELTLFGRRKEFDFRGQFHPSIVAQITRHFNALKGEALSSTGTRPVVSPRQTT